MSTKIFVNLPVKDLDASRRFFEALGFSFNPQFTDDTAACMVISEHAFAMLLTHPKFSEFTTKDIADARRVCEVMTALSLASKEEVDRMVETAAAHGGRDARPAKDYGFMYARAFEDPDGHIWEPFWMDPSFARS
jgi:predicted lactoylglutathione lyase